MLSRWLGANWYATLPTMPSCAFWVPVWIRYGTGVLESAGARDAVEPSELVDELLLVGVRDACHDPELAGEAVAERCAPVLTGLSVVVHRHPEILEGPPVLRDLVRRKANIGRVDALANNLVAWETRGKRSRAVVEAPRVAAAQRAHRDARPGRGGVEVQAVREVDALADSAASSARSAPGRRRTRPSDRASTTC